MGNTPVLREIPVQVAAQTSQQRGRRLLPIVRGDDHVANGDERVSNAIDPLARRDVSLLDQQQRLAIGVVTKGRDRKRDRYPPAVGAGLRDLALPPQDL